MRGERCLYLQHNYVLFLCVSILQASGPRTRKRLRRALPGRSVTGRSRSFHTAGDRPRRRNSRRMLADASNPPARPPRHESRPAGVAALISLCHLAMLAWELQRLLHCTPPPLAGRPASRLVSFVHARWLARSSMVSVSDGGGGGSNRCCTAQRWRHPACLTLLKWRRERARRPREDEAHDSEPPRARRTDERRI